MARAFNGSIYKYEKIMGSWWKSHVFSSWFENMSFSSWPNDIFQFLYSSAKRSCHDLLRKGLVFTVAITHKKNDCRFKFCELTFSSCTGMISYQLDFQPGVQNLGWLLMIVLKVGNAFKVFSWHIFAIRNKKKHVV